MMLGFRAQHFKHVIWSKHSQIDHNVKLAQSESTCYLFRTGAGGVAEMTERNQRRKEAITARENDYADCAYMIKCVSALIRSRRRGGTVYSCITGSARCCNLLGEQVSHTGHLGQSAMKHLHSLGDEAPGPGGVTRASSVNGTVRELSVGLCRGNFLSYRASVGMFPLLLLEWKARYDGQYAADTRFVVPKSRAVSFQHDLQVPHHGPQPGGARNFDRRESVVQLPLFSIVFGIVYEYRVEVHRVPVL
jgi:hypothetical protein